MKNSYNNDTTGTENEYTLVTYPDGIKQELENCDDIIEHCVDTKLNFNLINDSYETLEECKVINSVSTDIEILNAITGILSLMLTSNQFLSVNRSYDRKISKQQAMDIVAKEKAYVVKTVINEILNLDEATIKNSSIYSLLRENSVSLKLFLKKLFK
jgi:DNA-binding transcriptional regulator YhcF (GntR family)